MSKNIKAKIIFVNILTFCRIIGLILFIPIYLKKGGLFTAVFAMVCYLSDCADGILARKWHVSTFFGSLFDSIADKLFSIANLILFLTITKLAIFPIICEFLIALIQSIKFQKNINIQSSKIGKLKTWIMAITIIILYLSISFDFINVNLNAILIPLCIFEILTIISYLRINEKNILLEKDKLEIKFKKNKTLKDRWDNFVTLWFNPEFYDKYKDSADLKEIRKYLRNNRI